jgi:hypothetical protein
MSSGTPRGDWSVKKKKKKKRLSAGRGEGSVVGLQLRVRFVPAALLAMLRTALALQCVSKARDWTSHAAPHHQRESPRQQYLELRLWQIPGLREAEYVGQAVTGSRSALRTAISPLLCLIPSPVLLLNSAVDA